MDKINSSGTEDGDRLIIELMITSHSHEFTQIMQMKSYHEWTLGLLCSVFTLSVFTLDLLCSDHFQWHIHGKFSMTISLLSRRHRDAKGIRPILYRCFSFFLLFSTPNLWGHWNGSQPNLDIHSHMIHLIMTAIWKIWF